MWLTDNNGTVVRDSCDSYTQRGRVKVIQKAITSISCFNRPLIYSGIGKVQP